ncbi:MAG: mRNA interferase MazF [Gammaproteobacteria bacterium]|jgi:mRNA interferase MazF
MRRGEIWWADLPEPSGSEPGFRRPVAVLRAGEFNRSHIETVIAAAITSNTTIAQAPENVALSPRSFGPDRSSVINMPQIVILDKRFFTEQIGRLSARKLREVEDGVRNAACAVAICRKAERLSLATRQVNAMHKDVRLYLDAVPNERKSVVDKLHELITGLYPAAIVDISYRMPTYKAKDGWVAIANQKDSVWLYICGALHLVAFKAKHPKTKTGKGCINFKATDRIPDPVIKHAIEQS